MNTIRLTNTENFRVLVLCTKDLPDQTVFILGEEQRRPLAIEKLADIKIQAIPRFPKPVLIQKSSPKDFYYNQHRRGKTKP